MLFVFAQKRGVWDATLGVNVWLHNTHCDRCTYISAFSRFLKSAFIPIEQSVRAVAN